MNIASPGEVIECKDEERIIDALWHGPLCGGMMTTTALLKLRVSL